MPFQKGHKKIGGRKKGGQNKLTKDFRERVQLLIDEQWPSVLKDISELDPKSRMDIIIKLMEFVLPKLNKVSIERSVRVDDLLNMTESERRDRIHFLRKNIEEND